MKIVTVTNICMKVAQYFLATILVIAFMPISIAVYLENNKELSYYELFTCLVLFISWCAVPVYMNWAVILAAMR